MISPPSLPHDWYPVPLPPNVEIGAGSWLYSSFAFIHCQSTRRQAVRIGRSSGVYNGSFFDLGPNGEVQIGDYSTLVSAVICTDRKVVIGDYVFIAHDVMLADQHVAFPLSIESTPAATSSAKSADAGGIVIGENVWIGAGAIILSGAQIGTGAIIGAAALVDFEVPAYAVVAGNPGRIVTNPRAKP